MARFVYYNRNDDKIKRNDCVTRSISLASGLEYSTIRRKLRYTARLLDCCKLCVSCYEFLIREVLGGTPVNCEGMSINEFAELHPQGTYLLRMDGHITTLIDFTLYDIFDCRQERITNAWKIKN
jgi:hypothetical protein